ncbi:Hypothetical protein NTJ_12052 [Nesidiocoris tenuis]|uniref:Uncharacterized protein n=1 Tax=Nesidiocoris tenuis TaxID=355587 RepID=A0ABN7B4A8_9HEMI|nr:Hypothetical protein NTJ_12052 [Nesidiocoris tenuis]
MLAPPWDERALENRTREPIFEHFPDVLGYSTFSTNRAGLLRKRREIGNFRKKPGRHNLRRGVRRKSKEKEGHSIRIGKYLELPFTRIRQAAPCWHFLNSKMAARVAADAEHSLRDICQQRR